MRSSARARYLVLFVPVIAAFALFAVGPATRPAAVDEKRVGAFGVTAPVRDPGTDEVQLIVELDEPSVIAALVAPPTGLPAGARLATGAAEVNLKSAAAADAGTRVAAAQRQFADRLKSVDGAQVQAGVDLVLDAVIVRVPTSQYQRYAGSRSPSRPLLKAQKMDLDAAAQLQNSQALWNRVGGNANAGRERRSASSIQVSTSTTRCSSTRRSPRRPAIQGRWDLHQQQGNRGAAVHRPPRLSPDRQDGDRRVGHGVSWPLCCRKQVTALSRR